MTSESGSRTTELFDNGSYLIGQAGAHTYDVMPDGRFVMIRTENEDDSRNQVNVVLNWTSSLVTPRQDFFIDDSGTNVCFGAGAAGAVGSTLAFSSPWSNFNCQYISVTWASCRAVRRA